jgi:hypothetical protein
LRWGFERNCDTASPAILYNGPMTAVNGSNRQTLILWPFLALCGLLTLAAASAQEKGGSSLVYYQRARPVVDLKVEELRQGYPELANVRFSEEEGDLPSVLSRTGETQEAFFRYFPNTISREKVRQERVGENGRVEAHLDQESFYLVVARTGRETSGFDESRTDAKGRPVTRKRLKGQSFLTSGFAGVSIFFLPVNQKEFRFRFLGRDDERCGAYVVAFSAKRESSLLGKIEIGGEEALLLSQGLVWIHPDSFRLLAMTTEIQSILAPQPLVLTLRTSILFEDVDFTSSARTFSLPVKVEVNVNWRGTLHRNIHRYSDYRLFSVETHETRAPVAKP